MKVEHVSQGVVITDPAQAGNVRWSVSIDKDGRIMIANAEHLHVIGCNCVSIDSCRDVKLFACHMVSLVDCIKEEIKNGKGIS